VGKDMKSLLTYLFIKEWYHKCTAILLAVIIWLAVNHSQSTSKLLENIAVRVINIPPGSTVEGLLPSGILNKRLPITVHGKKLFLDELSANDVEVVIDAKDKITEPVVMVSKKTSFLLIQTSIYPSRSHGLPHATYLCKLFA
jgi:YbbR domain-containing protein